MLNPDLQIMVGKTIQEDRLREAEAWRVREAFRPQHDSGSTVGARLQRLVAAIRQRVRLRAFAQQSDHRAIE